MKTDLVIKNVKIVLPYTILNGFGVSIEDGIIQQIGKESHLPEAETTINGNGNYLLSGIIEPHTHLGYGSTEMFDSQVRTETTSAAC